MALLMCPQFSGRLLGSVTRRCVTGMLKRSNLGSIERAVSTLARRCQVRWLQSLKESHTRSYQITSSSQDASMHAISWLRTAAVMLHTIGWQPKLPFPPAHKHTGQRRRCIVFRSPWRLTFGKTYG